MSTIPIKANPPIAKKNGPKNSLNKYRSRIENLFSLLLINFCERILNPYPNEISLSMEDKQMFNSTDELFEKIRYISRMDYFKTL